MTPLEIKKPKVSVIVPTYQRGRLFLMQCLDSLYSQTYSNFEIVIVDDNPSDSEYSKEVLYTINHFNQKNIKYIKTKNNLGSALARNKGILIAEGKYITFLDDDDLYLPQKIQSQIEYMLTHALDMSFTDLVLCRMDDKTVDLRRHDYIDNCSNESLIKMHLVHNITGTSTFMIERDKLLEIGMFPDVILSEDYYLMESAIQNNLKIGYLSMAYVKARRHNFGGESFSERKIKGEKLLYQNKKKSFYLLTFAQRLQVLSRHLAVMAVSYYRNKRLFMAAIYALSSFIVSPGFILHEVLRTKSAVKQYNKTDKK